MPSKQNTFEVTIRATIIKTVNVKADSQEAAEVQAHAEFTVECEGPLETYKQEVMHTENVSPLPWVVIDGGGTVDEVEVDDFSTMAAALAFIKKSGQGDLMKRLANGSLTTDF